LVGVGLEWDGGHGGEFGELAEVDDDVQGVLFAGEVGGELGGGGEELGLEPLDGGVALVAEENGERE
jgi:hypothetical protein